MKRSKKMCIAVWDSVDSTSVVVSQYGQQREQTTKKAKPAHHLFLFSSYPLLHVPTSSKDLFSFLQFGRSKQRLLTHEPAIVRPRSLVWLQNLANSQVSVTSYSKYISLVVQAKTRQDSNYNYRLGTCCKLGRETNRRMVFAEIPGDFRVRNRLWSSWNGT